MMKWRVSAESSYSVAVSHEAACVVHGGSSYLKQAIYYLPSYIVFMSGEERRLEELERAPGDVILRLDVLPCLCQALTPWRV